MKFQQLILEMKTLDFVNVSLDYRQMNNRFNVFGPVMHFCELPIGEIKKFKFTEKELDAFKKKFKTGNFGNNVLNDMKSIKDFLIKENIVLMAPDNKRGYFKNEGYIFDVVIESFLNTNKKQLSFYCAKKKINNKLSIWDLVYNTSHFFRPKVNSNVTMSKVFEIGFKLIKQLKLKSFVFSGVKQQITKKLSEDKLGRSARDRLYLILLKKKFGNLNNVEQLKSREGSYFKVTLK